MPATVTWLWFGNADQLNQDPSTPPTQSEADEAIGYARGGPEQIRPVELTGTTVNIGSWWNPNEVFATTYNSGTTSDFTYDSPAGGLTPSQITGFLGIEYRLTLPDGTTRDESGVGIQMANGDVFFRPSSDSAPAWADIEGLRSVEIIGASPLPANTYVATVSFGPQIFDLDIVCFAAGTLIRTPQGERRVEDLAVGDLVCTADNGPQPLRWRGQRHLDAAELAARPRLRPIRIRAGALGQDRPAQDLVVSPQHRILVRSAIARRMFGTDELLVAARQLTALPGVEVELEAPHVTYVHLMFDNHEVVTSNGAESESLYPGPQALHALDRKALAEILAIFPELRGRDEPFPGARPFAEGHRARKLAQRHAANRRPLTN